jgi:hypothetical protein
MWEAFSSFRHHAQEGEGEMRVQALKGQRTFDKSLANLRTILEALDRAGDFTNPSIVNLRKLIVERVSSLEMSEK